MAIADLKLRIAQLKAGSGIGSDALASAEFIDLLQHNLAVGKNARRHWRTTTEQVRGTTSVACVLSSSCALSHLGSHPPPDVFSDTDDADYKTILISSLREKFSIHVTRVTTTNRKGAALSCNSLHCGRRRSGC